MYIIYVYICIYIYIYIYIYKRLLNKQRSSIKSLLHVFGKWERHPSEGVLIGANAKQVS